MITLDKREHDIASKIWELKKASGTHSPSIFTIAQKIPEIDIRIDACFLSNPYATELFMKHVESELIQTKKIREVMEFYPSQNGVIADVISKGINISKENIFVGNGAIEIIQAVLHNFVYKKLVVNIPTFSSYYEFANGDTQVVFHALKKENNYLLDVEEYVKFIKNEKPQSVVIINPNNPNGGYIDYNSLFYILSELKEVENIIIDESFIHFAFENVEYIPISYNKLFEQFSNIILIKSMSKDFGIAGIRAGYAIMSKQKIAKLLKNGYLWNSNGLSEYFFRLYSTESFKQKYECVRKKYIKQTQDFFTRLSHIKQIKTYKSKANFALIELTDGSKCTDFVIKMLLQYGIYTRTCNDKMGLSGEFVRIASRTEQENKIILKSMQDIFN
ncbi:histidinol-phosphate transaminase [Helicobacter trogontum]|uniref:Aminotransferase n=1 Tax=Helicobacter trogontum TaxID=50960 RepID=A0ABQ0D6R8_9HELI